MVSESSPLSFEAPKTSQNKSIHDLVTRDFNGLSPEVIFPFSGSITQRRDGRWDTLSGSDLSEHGLVTVGKARSIAGAEIASLFPEAAVVTNSYNRFNADEPTMASVVRSELIRRGVGAERIITEEESFSTVTQYIEMLKLAIEHEWTRLSVVINEYYFTRATALYENLGSIVEYDNPQDTQEFQEMLRKFHSMNGTVSFVIADNVMRLMNDRWSTYFDTLKQTNGYKKTVEMEAKGLADLQAGKYRVVLSPEKPRYNTN